MRTTDTDQILMQRLQAGDESAFEVLVHKYQGLVLEPLPPLPRLPVPRRRGRGPGGLRPGLQGRG